MRKSVYLSLALAALTTFAAGCGGGGSAPGALPPSNGSPSGPGSTNQAASVTFAIKIPGAVASSARKPGYVSSGTQSIGVVVTNQGATPSPAQYVNVSTCPQPSGVTTCSVTVAALPGIDSFAITAYSGQNGGGSILSTGSISSTVVAGTANVTAPVTLGGAIASIALTPGIATLPLGQSTIVNVVAKDASGSTIVGPFDNPITLSASSMALSSKSLTNSTDASNVTAAWNLGISANTASAINASGDGATGTVSMTPGTGFAYYQTGTNPTTDNGSVKMIAGPDGKLYYTSIGVAACTNGFCTAAVGAVHQFDPATQTDAEVALQSSGIGLTFTSDGALWIAGGAPVNGYKYVYRMAPGSFSSGSLTAIGIAGTGGNIRNFAQDGIGNVWFVDKTGRHYFSIPLAGPYTASSVVSHMLPNGPTGTPQYYAQGASIQYAGGSLVVADAGNGIVDVINPSTATVSGQYISNLQHTITSPVDSANPYDATTDGTAVYITFLGNWNAQGTPLGLGDIEKFDPATNTFTTMPTVSGLAAMQPAVPSVNGSYLYYADFGLNAFGYVNLGTNTARLFPTNQLGGSYFYGAGAAAAMSDGTAWFPCYGSAPTFQPLCVGHTTYFSKWSVWPSSSISIYGAGSGAAQLMGIMEAPSSNSGPFTISSNQTSVCTVTSPTTAADHNFSIVGQAAGACTVSIKDKNGVTQSVNVTVTTTSGTVQAKPHTGSK